MENKGEEDNMRDTSLVLGLNYESCGNSSWVDHRHEKEANFKYERSSFNYVPPGPSLSLALAVDDRACDSGKEYTGDKQAPPKSLTPPSVYHGLQSKMIKKENDAGSGETERPFSHSSDEEEEGSVRKKLRLTKEQSAFLEDKFKEQSTLNPKQKQALAEQLNLRPRQVEVWFQNRRARTKLKQTKADRELLMKCCETLTDENRRLQKELLELKIAKLSPGPPLIIQHPPAPGEAPFTKCPSCERVTGAKFAGPVVVRASEPHFLNPIAHSTTR